jgi:hypothetical protein
MAGPSRQDIAAGAIVIAKYWDDVPLFKDRFNQVRLFYVLKKMLKVRDRKMVHVGMRSGGLDMFGFSGQKAIYVSKAAGDSRMEPVANAFKDAGLGANYQKLAASRLPKRGAHHSAHKATAQRGFAVGDLDKLMAAIATALA